MYKHLFIRACWLIVVLALAGNVANGQVYGWTRGINTVDLSSGKSIGTDAAGNVYYTGAFAGIMDANPGTGASIMYSAPWSAVNYISKFGPTGDFLWSDTTNKTLVPGHVASLAVAPSGSTYTTGGTGIKIVKYNADGTRAWAHLLSNSSLENYVVYHDSGYIYLCGTFIDTVDFDPGPSTYNLASITSGYEETYVAKFDTNGAFIWARHFAGTSNQQPYALAVDKAGNAYVTGYFTTTVDFDPGSGASPLMASGSSQDMFVCRINNDGSFGWVKQIGGGNDELGRLIACGDGAIYTAESVFTGSGFNTYLLKLDGAGNTLWTRLVSPLGVSAIRADNMGSIYITGTFTGTRDFDLSTSGTHTLTAGGAYQQYVMKTDTGLAFQWVLATQGAGTSNCNPNDISVDAAGAMYLTGTFSGQVDFDPSPAVDTQAPDTSFPGPGMNPVSLYFMKWNSPTTAIPCVHACGEMYIAPNPTSEYLGIHSVDATAIGAVTVLNSVGMTVISRSISASYGVLDVSTLPPGVYLLVAGDRRLRFVKQ